MARLTVGATCCTALAKSAAVGKGFSLAAIANKAWFVKVETSYLP
ncbi:hypothetical protein [Nostoc sp. JL23]|nr:hypothetical protein [Nostoc sp. JL23]